MSHANTVAVSELVYALGIGMVSVPHLSSLGQQLSEMVNHSWMWLGFIESEHWIKKWFLDDDHGPVLGICMPN
jgi:hypothetical protein